MTLLPDIPRLTDASTDDDVAFATRAYLIRVLGGFLFPDTSKSLLNLNLLPYLEDFEDCGQYSWGSAVLAFLYRALCNASEHAKSHVCGCLLLLQIWAWERLPMVRPEGFLPAHDGQDLPLASRWGGPHDWATVPNHVVRAYRDQLDRVQTDSFVFQPYRLLLHRLPDYCRAGEDIWTAEVPLIFGYVVEEYFPSRFCRQFGAQQPMQLTDDDEDFISYMHPPHQWLQIFF
ncbi:PREDICTED: serine/threonine-protein phosphatase 7 long form homolog [Ipomoea nil]|uniref:serine/threonine-protein phosphatase 7 long form homolog n=1 Tax=Ipomoea nil TaxID=35883 RepID=UPI000901ED1D|nr:PREDICTED: serine/threonine-protein phosphatase 7 long form homolog [Ipomoea nil]